MGTSIPNKRQATTKGRSDSGLDTYLAEINRIPLLTREQEHELGLRILDGDENAVDEMVNANLRFVVSIAKRYAKQGVPLEDLINEGNIGLIKAARRFDVHRGYKFISYAVWWIRQAILHSLSQSSRIVRIPLNRTGILHQVGKASRELFQELGRNPSALEIAEHLDIKLKDVEIALRTPSTHVSLDEPYDSDSDDNALIDYLVDESTPSPDVPLYEETLGSDMRRALATLTEREQKIMTLYFGLGEEDPLTLEDVGRRLNLTRERIRQIKEQAIARLRHESRAKYIQGYAEN